MESAKATTKSSLTKYITVSGISLGILGASYFLIRALSQKQRKGPVILPKQTVIKILHDLRRELFPLFNALAGECRPYVQATGGNSIPTEFRSELLATASPTVDAITSQVAKKYGATLEDYDYSITEAYKEDKDVMLKLSDIATDLEKALDAKIELTKKIPEFLNAQRTYEIFVKTTKVGLRKVHEVGKEYVERNDIRGFLRQIRTAEVIAAKAEVMNKEGLGGFEDHPDNIMAAAINKYSREDQEFQRTFIKAFSAIEEVMNQMMNQDPYTEKAIEEFDEKMLKD